jgi:hypothetical protein
MLSLFALAFYAGLRCVDVDGRKGERKKKRIEKKIILVRKEAVSHFL